MAETSVTQFAPPLLLMLEQGCCSLTEHRVESKDSVEFGQCADGCVPEGAECYVQEDDCLRRKFT